MTGSVGVALENFSRADAGKLLRGFESASCPVFLVFFALAGSRLDLFALWAAIIPVALIAATHRVALFLGAAPRAARRGPRAVIATYAWTALVPQAGLSLALIVVIQKSFPSFGLAAAVLLLSVVAVDRLVAPSCCASASCAVARPGSARRVASRRATDGDRESARQEADRGRGQVRQRAVGLRLHARCRHQAADVPFATHHRLRDFVYHRRRLQQFLSDR